MPMVGGGDDDGRGHDRGGADRDGLPHFELVASLGRQPATRLLGQHIAGEAGVGAPDGLIGGPAQARVAEAVAILVSNRNPDSGQWLSASTMVEKTGAADVWFAAKAREVDAAQSAALADWQRKTPQARAALTLDKADAVLR